MVSFQSKEEATLEIRDVTKRFDDVIAMENVDLQITTGEFITLLGPSGSGKTTTLNIVAGFDTPTSGTVFLSGRDITYLPPYKRDIGMVFQNYALFPHMTVFDNIGFPLKMRRMKLDEIRKKVKWALELVQLPGFESRYINQMSGGQQQRIALARALVFEPSLLLMDEPLGALDKKLREHMQLEIKHMQKKLGITVIYVTHDQEEALVMSDLIAIMNFGQIQQIGSPSEIYSYPANEFVADFIGETNLVRGNVNRIKEDHCVIQTEDGINLKARSKEGIVVGAASCASIRPEKIALNPNPTNSKDEIEGVIEEVIYIGEITKYIVRVSDTVSFMVKMLNVEEDQNFKLGSKVYVEWSCDDCIAFI
jgi:spermidine/putrescine ABC transporter ATP-binding subunit